MTTPTGQELQAANKQLGRVLKDAERFLLQRYPGIEVEAPLVDSTTMKLAILKGKLTLTNGKTGSQCRLFDIDKAEPHQRIIMANHLGALRVALRDHIGSLVIQTKKATEAAEKFLRENQ